jgi:hypothetical protein
MLNKDAYLLERAYLSISQPVPSTPADEENVEPEMEQSAGMEMTEPEVMEPEMGCGCDGDKMYDLETEMNPHDEAEEDSMAVDNLNSVRESTMKIAQYWEKGGHLEPWQQQKLAIVMNSLAEIARSLH